MRIGLILLVLGGWGCCGVADGQDEQAVRPFLQSYCVGCHGSKAQKGDRRFDGLSGNIQNASQAEQLQEILDQLNLSTMPPEDAPQPPEAEVRRVVARLTAALAEARQAARTDPGKVVMRRLNRAEYRNTIRDLFQLKMVDFDPTLTFPDDDATDGFDNVGEGLLTSDYLLRNYLEAARKVADKVVRPGPRPAKIHYRLGSGPGCSGFGPGRAR